MEQVFDISEVTRKTGLTARALRFYEGRGLVKPVRTHSGRRLYGVAELERLNQIVALKRAGLTLAQVQKLTHHGAMDLRQLVDAQLEALESQKQEIEEARALLLSVKSRIDRGEPIDVATFCSLIRNGDRVMEAENWKKVADRYFTPEEQARWAERMQHVPADFDQHAYNQQWQALGRKIEAALPLDPASREAQTLLDEWRALLKPFNDVATPDMKVGASQLYDRMEEWQSDRKSPFSMEVWKFIQAAAAAHNQGS